MAGAEGFEPSALGFGVAVRKSLRRGTSRLFQPLAGFRSFHPSAVDAFLMLWLNPCPNAATHMSSTGQRNSHCQNTRLIIDCSKGIVGYQFYSLGLGLGNQHPIEWVIVLRGTIPPL